MRESRRGLLLLIATLVVCSFPTASIAEPQAIIVDLSRVGGPVSEEVLSYRGTGSCDKRGSEDCLFVSPEGVEYVVFAGTICAIDVDVTKVSKAITLPFGLKFGDSKVEAVAKLPKVKGVEGRWFVSDGRQVYLTDGFFGSSDGLRGVYLWFDATGRLVEAKAHSTCI